MYRLCIVMALLGALHLNAAEVRVRLTEQLNRAWENERVSWLLDFAEGTCVAASIMVVDGTGTAVPSQVSETELWEGDFVKRARVSILLPEVAPLSSQEFVVRYGSEARPGTPADAVAVRQADGRWMLRGAELALSVEAEHQQYDAPVAASEVAPPFRVLAAPSGELVRSELYGAGKIRERRFSMLENGPIFARIAVEYAYEDESELRVEMEVVKENPMVRITATAPGTVADAGWRVVSEQGAKPNEAIVMFGQRSYASELRVPLAAATQPLAWLSPWIGDKWWRDHANILRLSYPERAEDLVISIHDPDRWVEPQERPSWAHFNRWDYETIPVIWAGWQNQRAPLTASDEAVTIGLPHVNGTRIFSLGLTSDETAVLERVTSKRMGGQSPLPRLEDVQAMVLEWPDGEHPHPRLLLSAEGLAEAATRLPGHVTALQNAAPLRERLALLGSFDLFRYIVETACRYDAVIDGGQIEADERRLFRAQLAYLAYVNADPIHWSFERGFCSGNPNMTVSRVTNVGVMGLALGNHPMAEQWVHYAVDWVTWWLENVTTEAGGWPESSHYARVTWSEMVLFALMTKEAGVYNFFEHPKFRAMAEFHEQTLTPRDPLRVVAPQGSFNAQAQTARSGAPYGRGTRGDVWGISGLLAKGYADVDPAFSRHLQWSYRESALTWHLGHSTAGLTLLYVDPTLPAEAPAWSSRFYPSMGYVLRDHTGRADEDFLAFTSQYYQCPDGQLWPADTGSIAKWFARGVPLGGNFRRIPETSVLPLVNRVWLAQPWDPATGAHLDSGYETLTRHDAFASLPGLDYVSVHLDVPRMKPHWMKVAADFPALPPRAQAAEPPYQWQRQIMVDHLGSRFLVIRDTVLVDKPTQWQFWFLSEKLGAANEVADREAFLADKPGASVAPARELAGDHFVALGQFDLDVTILVAAPAATPRHTMRYGTKGSAYGAGNFLEYQDSLQLQREDAGAYFVAMVPQAKDVPAPIVTAAGDGRIIRIVEQPDGATALVFLSDTIARAEADGALFEGTAGSLRREGTRLDLWLAAPGTIAIDGYRVEADVAMRLSIDTATAALMLHKDAASEGKLMLTTPGKAAREIALPAGRDTLALTP